MVLMGVCKFLPARMMLAEATYLNVIFLYVLAMAKAHLLMDIC